VTTATASTPGLTAKISGADVVLTITDAAAMFALTITRNGKSIATYGYPTSAVPSTYTDKGIVTASAPGTVLDYGLQILLVDDIENVDVTTAPKAALAMGTVPSQTLTSASLLLRLS
jgi:hypothetical protein